MKKVAFKKTETIVWHQFTRHRDAIFLSLGREIRIGVLSVATLSVACPNSPAAMMAMSPHPANDETTVASASDDSTDDPLELSALQHGDLLFNVASPSRDGIAQAIVTVTEGVDFQRISHVAIVCKEANGLFYALEASSEHGVWLNPIDSFFVHSDQSPAGRPMVLLGRLKDPSLAATAVEKAKTFLGKPYDFLYMPNDSAIYCSELIHYSYSDAQGKALFPQQPMSFHDKNSLITAFWKEYYQQCNMPVPEGLSGTNPGGISRSENIQIIGQFF